MHDRNRVHISLIVLAVFTDRDSDFDDELEDHNLFEMSTFSFCHDSSHFILTLVSILFDWVSLIKIFHNHWWIDESTFFFQMFERITIDAFNQRLIFRLFFFEWCSSRILIWIELRSKWLDFKCFDMIFLILLADVIK